MGRSCRSGPARRSGVVHAVRCWESGLENVTGVGGWESQACRSRNPDTRALVSAHGGCERSPGKV